MNDKFFLLPLDKQQRIINAAYRVFSQNKYKKAPMAEIASAGNISKALLFHYFRNKKELYFYLWNNTIPSPYLYSFSVKAYYETEPEVLESIQRSF